MILVHMVNNENRKLIHNLYYKISEAASRLSPGCYENNMSKVQTIVSNANTNLYFCTTYSTIIRKYNTGVGENANIVPSIE